MHVLMSQMIRFSITGSFATLVHFSAVAILVELFYQHPLIANIYGFFCGFIVSFSGHQFWTFSNTKRSVRASLPRFLIIAGINLTGNQTLYYLLLTKLHTQYLIALAIVLNFMGLVTFFLSKWWAFC